jgi:uncharacterized protein (TIGR03790 family)
MARNAPRLVLLCVLLAIAAVARAVAAEISPEQVLVVANSSVPESITLARHYLKARSIPARNLISLPFSTSEEVSWGEFARNLWNPLLELLASEGWIRGRFADGHDKAGRRRILCEENRVRYLVLCRGVPLRIKDSPALWRREIGGDAAISPARGMENNASVDSELALLAHGSSPASGHLPNPLFGQAGFFPQARARIIVTARLDGPSLRDCLRLVDDAVAAERTGLAGRAYMDLGGPYPDGDQWLRNTAAEIGRAGFDTSSETTRALFQPGCRSDAPALYFGWYAAHASGRFGEDSLRFEPGAIAVHIHSFSAATLRTGSSHWCGPLIARGAALTFGNVAEPYLHLTTRPDIFIAALLRGGQAGEAYAAATPAWSWQGILVGDPLYRPFKMTLPMQVALLREQGAENVRPGWRDGVLLRQANQIGLDARRDGPPPRPTAPDAAVEMLAAAVRERPTPALHLALARAAAHPGLAWAGPEVFAGADPGLLAETARFLWAEGRSRDAFPAYETLLSRKDLPPAFRKKITREAVEAAEAAGYSELAKRWGSGL